MRVAIIHNQLARGGGAERYLLDIISGFRAFGDDVEIWARQIDPQLSAELGIRAHRVPVWPSLRMLRTRLMSGAVEKLHLKDRYDLVLSLARTRGQHGWICGGTHPGFLAAMGRKPSLRDRIEIDTEREALVSANCGIAHSRLLAEELSRYHRVPAEHIQTIYPPVDTAAFRPADGADRTRARAAFGLEPGLKYFLFPSLGHFRKGFDLLLQAFETLQHAPLRLLVAGNPPGQRVPANVMPMGYVRQMADLYAAADATVLPSRYEPFGLVLAESLQRGTPIITSPQAGIVDLLRPEDGLVLPSLDVTSLHQALLQMAENSHPRVGGFAEREGLTLPVHIEKLRGIPRG